jgi:Na+/melibiose symporter-like transporter
MQLAFALVLVPLILSAVMCAHERLASVQLALTLVLVPPILSAVVYILRVASPYMPLYLWAFVFVLQLVMMTVYPTLIAPLFNKYEKLEAGKLRSAIEELASTLKFPLRKLFVVDGSKRSGHSNAYMCALVSCSAAAVRAPQPMQRSLRS